VGILDEIDMGKEKTGKWTWKKGSLGWRGGGFRGRTWGTQGKKRAEGGLQKEGDTIGELDRKGGDACLRGARTIGARIFKSIRGTTSDLPKLERGRR